MNVMTLTLRLALIFVSMRVLSSLVLVLLGRHLQVMGEHVEVLHYLLVLCWNCIAKYVIMLIILVILVCYHDGLQYLYGDTVKIGCNWW